MREVTVDNFDEEFAKIEASIAASRFVSIDMEFAALYLEEGDKASLFDTIEERYAKLRRTITEIKPLQVGVSAFRFDPDRGDYTADTFTFYTFPRPFVDVNQKVAFTSSSFQFLANHDFNFNKLIYSGVPFLNSLEEEALRKKLKLGQFEKVDEIEQILEDVVPIVSKWFYAVGADKDELVVDACPAVILKNAGYLYTLHKHIRHRFQSMVWTYVRNNRLCVRKVTPEEYVSFCRLHDLEVETLDSALGFTKVYRLLMKHRKPVVGHNLLMDLMLMYNTFEAPLPKTCKEFKRALHEKLPEVYDTKSLSFDVSRQIPKNKIWRQNTLRDLYIYFRDLDGRHLAFKSPLIQMTGRSGDDRFHDAGWDSYCTGYIFVRMAHFAATVPYKVQNRTITSAEHFAAVRHVRNQVNLIRCSVSSIVLDGDDPKSTRPPCLIAEANKKKLDISEITSTLSSYGYVEVKSFNPRKALIAVDNYGNAKRIVKQFGSYSDFRIQWYNAVRHSAMMKTVIWSGILASGSILMFLAHKSLK